LTVNVAVDPPRTTAGRGECGRSAAAPVHLPRAALSADDTAHAEKRAGRHQPGPRKPRS